jgi:hypothetical protein
MSMHIVPIIMMRLSMEKIMMLILGVLRKELTLFRIKFLIVSLYTVLIKLMFRQINCWPRASADLEYLQLIPPVALKKNQMTVCNI